MPDLTLSPAEAEALWLSLKVGVVGALLSLPPGLAAAWALSRRECPGKFALDLIIPMPLVMPPVVTGYLLLLAFGNRGVIGSWLNDTLGFTLAFNWKGAALAAAIMGFPLLVRALRLSFDAVDTRLEQAARTLGASRLDTMMSVTLPLILPGLVTGLLLAFARGLGEFGATITFVSNIPGETQTLSLAIYALLQSPSGDAAALRLIAIAVALALAAIAGAASGAFAQDSVSNNNDGGNGLPGDAFTPYDVDKCQDFVVDLTPFTTSKGTSFGIAPLIKTSKVSDSFFGSRGSAQAISPDLRSGVPYAAASYALWATPGQGVHPTNNDAANLINPPAATGNQFSVAMNEFATNNGGATHEGVVGAIVNYDTATPSRLYVHRVMAATSGVDLTQATAAPSGAIPSDATGNVYSRADASARPPPPEPRPDPPPCFWAVPIGPAQPPAPLPVRLLYPPYPAPAPPSLHLRGPRSLQTHTT